MRILMTSHYTLPHRGGIETIIEKLSLALNEHGIEVRIVSSMVEGQTAFDRPGREIIGIPAFDPLRRHGVHYPIFAPALFSVLYREARQADLIHVQGMLYMNSFLALLFARLLGRPAVLTEHAGFVRYTRAFFNFIQSIGVQTIGRLSLALSDVVIVPDVIVQRILEEELGVLPRKIVRIPLGVDTDIFHPLTEEEKRSLRMTLGWDERPKVLFVGNYVARKRIPLLLEALSDRFDLVLCGEGYSRADLPSRVMLYPPLGHEKLAQLYQAADLFVVPSSVETFAIVAYEAMACGLPVIMTDDLLHLTVRDSGLVEFVSPTAAGLRMAIHNLLDQPLERRRRGQESARWVREHFDWKVSVQQHLELYRSLLRLR